MQATQGGETVANRLRKPWVPTPDKTDISTGLFAGGKASELTRKIDGCVRSMSSELGGCFNNEMRLTPLLLNGDQYSMNPLEAKVKHLELIQNVITRLGNNSFAIKNWAITTVTAIIGFASSQQDHSNGILALIKLQSNSGDAPNYLALCISITCIFWLLSAYYLFMEREFRRHYNKIRMLPEADLTFSMSPDRKILFCFWHYTKTLLSLPMLIVYTPMIGVSCYMLINKSN